jgi:hypothetical protein
MLALKGRGQSRSPAPYQSISGHTAEQIRALHYSPGESSNVRGAPTCMSIQEIVEVSSSPA